MTESTKSARQLTQTAKQSRNGIRDRDPLFLHYGQNAIESNAAGFRDDEACSIEKGSKGIPYASNRASGAQQQYTIA
jgi:hypothetical protein